ncbi:hypothetical protein Lery_2049 [Legionella erythra]|uniref:Uncharacterized protein n=1 Tax=Legionella erythra TaxID=448 RepID=A0A0W0TJL8_LEGER|nr:hypothetical protein Lery_2049 [Legionella erythra]
MDAVAISNCAYAPRLVGRTRGWDCGRWVPRPSRGTWEPGYRVYVPRLVGRTPWLGLRLVGTAAKPRYVGARVSCLRSAPCARNPALTSISDPANAIHNLAAGIRAAFMVKSRFYLHVSAAILLSGLWHFTFSRLALTEYGLIDAQFRIILCNSLAKGTYDTPDFTRHR